MLTVPQIRRYADTQIRRYAERLNLFQLYTEAWVHAIASGGGAFDVEDGVD